MLDYYGSIMMSKDNVKNDIINTQKYKEYNKEYILNIIDILYSKGFLKKKQLYSYSGWGIFNKPIAIEYIDNFIKLNTLNCKKKLAVVLQLKYSKDIGYEPGLFKQICDNLIINLIYRN